MGNDVYYVENSINFGSEKIEKRSPDNDEKIQEYFVGDFINDFTASHDKSSVYVSTGGTLFAFNKDGTQRWTQNYSVFDDRQDKYVAVDDDDNYLYVSTEKGPDGGNPAIKKLDTSTGNTVYSKVLDSPTEPNQIDIGSDGNIYYTVNSVKSRTPDGTKRWTTTQDVANPDDIGTRSQDPGFSLDGDVVYSANESKNVVYAFKKSDGSLIDSASVSDPVRIAANDSTDFIAVSPSVSGKLSLFTFSNGSFQFKDSNTNGDNASISDLIMDERDSPVIWQASGDSTNAFKSQVVNGSLSPSETVSVNVSDIMIFVKGISSIFNVSAAQVEGTASLLTGYALEKIPVGQTSSTGVLSDALTSLSLGSVSPQVSSEIGKGKVSQATIGDATAPLGDDVYYTHARSSDIVQRRSTIDDTVITEYKPSGGYEFGRVKNVVASNDKTSVYVLDEGENVYGFDEDGTLRFGEKGYPRDVLRGFALGSDNNYLYVGTAANDFNGYNDTRIYKIDTTTGDLVDSFIVSSNAKEDVYNITVDSSGDLYFTVGGDIVSYKPDGTKRWDVTVSAGTVGAKVSSIGVHVTDGENTGTQVLYTYDKSGNQINSLSKPAFSEFDVNGKSGRLALTRSEKDSLDNYITDIDVYTWDETNQTFNFYTSIDDIDGRAEELVFTQDNGFILEVEDDNEIRKFSGEYYDTEKTIVSGTLDKIVSDYIEEILPTFSTSATQVAGTTDLFTSRILEMFSVGQASSTGVLSDALTSLSLDSVSPQVLSDSGQGNLSQATLSGSQMITDSVVYDTTVDFSLSSTRVLSVGKAGVPTTNLFLDVSQSIGFGESALVGQKDILATVQEGVSGYINDAIISDLISFIDASLISADSVFFDTSIQNNVSSSQFVGEGTGFNGDLSMSLSSVSETSEALRFDAGLSLDIVASQSFATSFVDASIVDMLLRGFQSTGDVRLFEPDKKLLLVLDESERFGIVNAEVLDTSMLVYLDSSSLTVDSQMLGVRRDVLELNELGRTGVVLVSKSSLN